MSYDKQSFEISTYHDLHFIADTVVRSLTDTENLLKEKW